MWSDGDGETAGKAQEDEDIAQDHQLPDSRQTDCKDEPERSDAFVLRYFQSPCGLYPVFHPGDKRNEHFYRGDLLIQTSTSTREILSVAVFVGIKRGATFITLDEETGMLGFLESDGADVGGSSSQGNAGDDNGQDFAIDDTIERAGGAQQQKSGSLSSFFGNLLTSLSASSSTTTRSKDGPSSSTTSSLMSPEVHLSRGPRGKSRAEEVSVIRGTIAYAKLAFHYYYTSRRFVSVRDFYESLTSSSSSDTDSSTHTSSTTACCEGTTTTTVTTSVLHELSKFFTEYLDTIFAVSWPILIGTDYRQTSGGEEEPLLQLFVPRGTQQSTISEIANATSRSGPFEVWRVRKRGNVWLPFDCQKAVSALREVLLSLLHMDSAAFPSLFSSDAYNSACRGLARFLENECCSKGRRREQGATATSAPSDEVKWVWRGRNALLRSEEMARKRRRRQRNRVLSYAEQHGHRILTLQERSNMPKRRGGSTSPKKARKSRVEGEAATPPTRSSVMPFPQEDESQASGVAENEKTNQQEEPRPSPTSPSTARSRHDEDHSADNIASSTTEENPSDTEDDEESSTSDSLASAESGTFSEDGLLRYNNDDAPQVEEHPLWLRKIVGDVALFFRKWMRGKYSVFGYDSSRRQLFLDCIALLSLECFRLLEQVKQECEEVKRSLANLGFEIDELCQPGQRTSSSVLTSSTAPSAVVRSTRRQDQQDQVDHLSLNPAQGDHRQKVKDGQIVTTAGEKSRAAPSQNKSCASTTTTTILLDLRNLLVVAACMLDIRRDVLAPHIGIFEKLGVALVPSTTRKTPSQKNEDITRYHRERILPLLVLDDDGEDRMRRLHDYESSLPDPSLLGGAGRHLTRHQIASLLQTTAQRLDRVTAAEQKVLYMLLGDRYSSWSSRSSSTSGVIDEPLVQLHVGPHSFPTTLMVEQLQPEREGLAEVTTNEIDEAAEQVDQQGAGDENEDGTSTSKTVFDRGDADAHVAASHVKLDQHARGSGMPNSNFPGSAVAKTGKATSKDVDIFFEKVDLDVIQRIRDVLAASHLEPMSDTT
ncbi:unnamed protein product [Amoebophrya sp. A25]|nr:unnamed protein product [Amoebophrya sp. A25]|eukprot:GSA25T00022903001.1